MTRLDPGLVVVKVGGSLFDWPELPARLGAYLDRWRGYRVVLIAGGGAIADQVRAFDRLHGLDDEEAHWLAIRAMDLSGRLLASVLSGVVVVERLDALGDVLEAGRMAALVPGGAFAEIDCLAAEPLPASWDVTSDTIAARIADHLGASCLVLVKSASLPVGTDRRQAVELGLVDRMFVRFASRLPRVEYVNLRDLSAVRADVLAH